MLEAATAAALLYAGYQILSKFFLYIAGLHGPDATLYFTMGNAIRNGLIIYRDVFDPKPPGIFLLSAASFSLFGDGRITGVFNVIILLSIPALFLRWGYVYAKKQEKFTRFILLQCALMLGLTFTLYHATIGGDVQTEFYGAFFGLLYLLCVDADQRRPGILNVLFASVFFAIALLFKEPFLLTLLACAVLMLRARREWVRLFIVPLITAGVLYIVVLASLGALGSYLSVYLTSMLGNYILSGGPVWARGFFAWERIFLNVREFTLLFVVLVPVLFILSLPPDASKRRSFIGITGTIFSIAVVLIIRSFYPAQFPWQILPIPSAVIFGLSVMALIIALQLSSFRAFLQRTWRHALAVYITVTAIALGSSFHGQYFALALPVYATFFLLFLRQSRHSSPKILGFTALTALVLLTSTPFISSGRTLAQMTGQIRQTEERDRTAAQALDQMLDACSIDRYYFLEDRAYMPYAEHSPLNYYLYTRIEHIGRYHPQFFDESFKRLGQARVIVLSKEYEPVTRPGYALEECIGMSVQKFLSEKFTETPWACAQSRTSPDGYIMLYRKDPKDVSLPSDCHGSRSLP